MVILPPCYYSLYCMRTSHENSSIKQHSCSHTDRCLCWGPARSSPPLCPRSLLPPFVVASETKKEKLKLRNQPTPLRPPQFGATAAVGILRWWRGGRGLNSLNAIWIAPLLLPFITMMKALGNYQFCLSTSESFVWHANGRHWWSQSLRFVSTSH